MAKESKSALAKNKKRGEQMYLRLGILERATRWPTIVAHALSLMLKGQPDHQAAKVAQAKAAKKKAAAVPESIPMVAIPPDQVAFHTPVSEAPPIASSTPPSGGNYDHDYYHNMYRYRPPVEKHPEWHPGEGIDPSLDHPAD